MRKSKILLVQIIIVGLLFSLSANVNAYALVPYDRDFELRNEIHFGDSFEVVQEKEPLSFKKDDDSINVIGEAFEADYHQTEGGVIAGIPDTIVNYYFGKDDSLYEMSYQFPVTYDKDDFLENFRQIDEGLLRKYGAPMDLEEGKQYPIISNQRLLSLFACSALLLSEDYQDADIIIPYEWAFACDGYNVKLDLFGYYIVESSGNIQYYLVLAYHKFTDEDLTDAILSELNRQNSIDSDL